MKPGSIIPSNVASLRSLTVTMAVMSYLACLAIGALILVDRAVTSWTSSLSQEMTVQIARVRGGDIDADVAKAQSIAAGFPGILEAEVLPEEAGAKLLEPWLGTRSLEGLPVPRLIRLVTSPDHQMDVIALEKALSQIKGVHLDTHRRWEAELTRMAQALSVLSYAILLLISVSAIAIVIFATRAVLQANRPIVDLLHLVGARDSYIARQIDGRFLRTGMLSGLIGVCLGLATFLLLGISSGSGMAAASRSLLFSAPEIAIWSYGFLFAVPVAATLICLITARITLNAAPGDRDMIYVRSAVFNLVFYVNLVLFLLLGSVFYLTPRKWSIRALQVWARSSLFWLRLIAGIKMEVRGVENIPAGPCLIAGKHQSFWETFAILPLLDDPAVVLKKELSYIPFFGWFIYKFRMIPVERSAGLQALRSLTAAAGEAISLGRQVVIMPEGTRRAPDDPPDYKPGAAAVYGKLSVTCVPFALNSGLFWPRREFVRRPGTIVISFLDPIPPGLPRKQFQTALESAIESETARLVAEARLRL